MKSRWKYSGDVSLRNGGYFYDTSNIQYHYVDVVRVQPCSDAGGPDNEWWIESLTVNLPETDEALRIILRTCGWASEDVNSKPKDVREGMIIDACISHGQYDQNSSTVYRIGPKESVPAYTWDGHNENDVVQFRANASLRRRVKDAYLRD